jgi:small multidrug resistance family-3 protein
VSRTFALLILLAAAILEAVGDALVRAGLHNSRLVSRLLLFLIGGCVLFAYGWVVNVAPWDFGKLLGVYVVFFFVVAQLISFFAFAQKPTVSLLLGGSLIVAGGLVIGLART